MLQILLFNILILLRKMSKQFNFKGRSLNNAYICLLGICFGAVLFLSKICLTQKRAEYFSTTCKAFRHPQLI